MPFEVINADTTNTLAAFEAQDEALREYNEICNQDRAHRDSYVVIEFDDDGEARGAVAGPRAVLERFGRAGA